MNREALPWLWLQWDYHRRYWPRSVAARVGLLGELRAALACDPATAMCVGTWAAPTPDEVEAWAEALAEEFGVERERARALAERLAAGA